MKAPEEQLIEVLAGIDVVISCVGPAEQQDQIPLAKAAKKCGVKRFIPCGFITVAPPGGVMWLRDEVWLVFCVVRPGYLRRWLIIVSFLVSERNCLQPDPPALASLYHR